MNIHKKLQVYSVIQSLLSLYFPIFLDFINSLIYSLLVLFLCFSRPYVTFLRCSDVNPLSLTQFCFLHTTAI